MKAIFGQVIAVAVLSLILVGVYFYKTSQASASMPLPGPALSVTAITPTAKTPPAEAAPKQDKIEVVGQTPKPMPGPKGQVYVRHGAPAPQHCFVWRVFHPRSWRIFHRGAPVQRTRTTVRVTTVACQSYWVCEPVVCQPVVLCP